MTLSFVHAGDSHAVFDSDPRASVVCGIIENTGEKCWEWQIHYRDGYFDTTINRYKPSLLKSGYASHREKALRQVVDYIESGVWYER